MKSSTDSQGVFHVLFSLVTLLVCLSGLGFWGILHHWKKLAYTQLRLNQCVEKTTLELKSILVALSQGNQRMKDIRKALAVGKVLPAALPALKAALLGEVLHQEQEKLRWQRRRLLWKRRKGCDGILHDQASSLPPLDCDRGFPDELGPKPLKWVRLGALLYQIELTHSPRTSAAYVEGENRDEDAGSWKASWGKRFRASFD